MVFFSVSIKILINFILSRGVVLPRDLVTDTFMSDLGERAFGAYRLWLHDRTYPRRSAASRIQRSFRAYRFRRGWKRFVTVNKSTCFRCHAVFFGNHSYCNTCWHTIHIRAHVYGGSCVICERLRNQGYHVATDDL